jgi:hypothetical protein
MKILARLSLLLLALGLRAEQAPAHTDLTVAIDAPTPAFTLRIVRVDRKGDEVAVLAEVQRIPADMVMQVITPLSARARIEGTAPRVRKYLLGQTWNWDNEGIQKVVDAADYGRLTEGFESVPFQTVLPENNK